MEPQTKKYPSIGKYELLRTLGAGYNAKVKLGLEHITGNHYAVKIIKRANYLNNEKAIRNEIDIMKQLDHLNIIKLVESEVGEYVKRSGETYKVLYVVLELATGGELFEYVASTGKFSDSVARTYFQQLINALEYCHRKGFAHRDLKPENLLYDKNFNLKVADFGFASALVGKDGSGKLKTQLGTESYMAPEIHAKKKYSGESVDLFAAGIILFIMYAGAPPFNKATPTDPYYRLIVNNKGETFWNAHLRNKPSKEFFSDSFKDLIFKMLAYEPTSRLTLAQLKAHPWYKGKTETAESLAKEFSKRKFIVTQEIEKERLKKELEKQKKKDNSLYTGNKGFRSEKELSDDVTAGIENSFPELKLKRTAREKEGEIGVNDMLSVVDPQYLLKFVVAKASALNMAVTGISKKGFKATLQGNSESGDSMELWVNILNFQGDSIVEFTRKSGSTLFYNEKANALRELISAL